MSVNLKNHRGLSEIVGVMILIVMAIFSAALVWVIVNNLISDQLDSESCAGNYGKITINGRYTCYDSSSNNLQFSIGVGDIDVDSVLISISETGATNSYTLTNVDQTIIGLVPYPSGSGQVKLPAKNAGLTYISTGPYSTKPDEIKISPMIGGKQCDVSDSLSDIDDCSILI